jgi:soluble lytic murein transglycosylase
MYLLLDFICAFALFSNFACLRQSGAPAANDAPAPTAILASGETTNFDLINSFSESVPTDDATLFATRRQDAQDRASNQFDSLNVNEQMRRAAIFMVNRAFDEARAHWQVVIEKYPSDANVPAALWGMGRSFYQQRRYAEALPYFERLGNEFATTREGRNGFYYTAPTLLRLNRASDAAERYIAYTQKFPTGERIEDAYFNIIDTMREAGRTGDALQWIDITRQRFPYPTPMLKCLFARLRLEVAEKLWDKAVATSDEILKSNLLREAGTSATEINYLRAYSLEQSGRAAEAIAAYNSIPEGASSFYGYAATLRLQNLTNASDVQKSQARSLAAVRAAQARRDILSKAADYPAPYRFEIVRAAQARGVDPRFLLAIMRQESSFKPHAKSPAAARGLMQLTFDTAQIYAPRAGYKNLQETDLYNPSVSIAIASVYFADLNRMFPDLLEPVAASYNGGEDNAARWLARAKSKDAGTFAAEVGYTETKDYVFKVMANYRAYKQLYDAYLRPQLRKVSTESF